MDPTHIGNVGISHQGKGVVILRPARPEGPKGTAAVVVQAQDENITHACGNEFEVSELSGSLKGSGGKEGAVIVGEDGVSEVISVPAEILSPGNFPAGQEIDEHGVVLPIAF